MLECEGMNYKNRAQRVAFNEAADWLIGVKFERGDKVTLKCATPCLYLVRQNHLICLRAFANTRHAIVRPRTHLLNFSFAFIVSFFFFFQPPWMMIPLCVRGRRMCVNWFIVFAQALEEFPPFLFLATNTSDIWDLYYTHAHCLLLLATLHLLLFI